MNQGERATKTIPVEQYFRKYQVLFILSGSSFDYITAAIYSATRISWSPEREADYHRLYSVRPAIDLSVARFEKLHSHCDCNAIFR
jgi:hypothetical protein